MAAQAKPVQPALINVYPKGMKMRPKHGSPLCELFDTIIVPSGPHKGEQLIITAADNIPDADIKLIESTVGKKQDSARWRNDLARNNLCNAICNKCLDKSDLLKLGLCDHCCLTWYCSEDCRAADQENHRLRCGRRNGPLDKGPMQLVFARLK